MSHSALVPPVQNLPARKANSYPLTRMGVDGADVNPKNPGKWQH